MEVARRPSNKKRHTKPCAFYQTMQCPFTADECDFAHVLNNGGFGPHLPIPSSRTKLCKYFNAGTCTQGFFCRFKHPSGQEPYPVPTEDHMSIDPALMQVDDIKKPHKRPSRPVVAVPSFPPGFDPSSGWTTYPYTAVQSPGFYIPHNLLSPTLTHDSSDSTPTLPSSASDQSSTSTTETDDIVVTMDALDDSHDESKSKPQAPSLPAKPNVLYAPHSTPLTEVEGLPATPQQYAGYYDPHQPCPASHGGRGRSQSLGKVKPKGISYKTKPCKFFKPDSVCPMGNMCTFVHDPAAGKQVLVSPTSSGSSPSEVQHELPPKPTSVYEENRKKGYFPISWRVIGGGVMMGGKRTICRSYLEGSCREGDDCKYSHDDPDAHIMESTAALSPASDISGDPTTPTPGAAMTRGRPVSGMKEDRRHSLPPPLPLADDFFPRVVIGNEGNSMDHVMGPRQAKTRPISMSGPTSPRVDISSLFASAESPGNL